MQGAHLLIQRLATGDAALAEQLNDLFGEAFEDLPTYQANRPGLDYLEQLLAKDDLIVIVGLVDGELAGGLVAYELSKLEAVRREIYIYDLAVREAHRRQRVATALIAELKRTASLRGASVIFVQADYGDDPAIQLYRKLGTQEEVLHFDITI